MAFAHKTKIISYNKSGSFRALIMHYIHTKLMHHNTLAYTIYTARIVNIIRLPKGGVLSANLEKRAALPEWNISCNSDHL